MTRDISKDGGPVFPLPDAPGISLRDFFAAVVIHGLYNGDARELKPEGFSRAAYGQADELLKIRDEQ